MDVGVSAGQRGERGGVTKEMVNFTGAERQVKYIAVWTIEVMVPPRNTPIASWQQILLDIIMM